jgi:7-carboxy-7-deazaguanine synthase
MPKPVRSSSSTRSSGLPDTVQGEGPSTGRICGFLRLGGCNLSCRWCDTPYTWDWTGISSPVAYKPAMELHPMSAAQVVRQLQEMDVDLVIVTGGEPLSQQVQLLPVLGQLHDQGIAVEVETNGTRSPGPDVQRIVRRFVVSPKLAHSGDLERRRLVPKALQAFRDSGKADFKFVVRSIDDLDEVAAIADEHRLAPIWIMPEGQTAEAISRSLTTIADAVVSRRWNLTTRLHILAWGQARGV